MTAVRRLPTNSLMTYPIEVSHLALLGIRVNGGRITPESCFSKSTLQVGLNLASALRKLQGFSARWASSQGCAGFQSAKCGRGFDRLFLKGVPEPVAIRESLLQVCLNAQHISEASPTGVKHFLASFAWGVFCPCTAEWKRRRSYRNERGNKARGLDEAILLSRKVQRDQPREI